VLGLGGATYPSASAIEPLAKGDAMIFDVTFPPGGSDNFGDRVAGIGLPKGVNPAEGWGQVLRRLDAKHVLDALIRGRHRLGRGRWNEKSEQP